MAKGLITSSKAMIKGMRVSDSAAKSSVESNASVGSLPLIKWPGGKRAIASHIIRHIPDTYSNYFEPFFGGGAIFFALNPEIATLSDANPELINAYVQVRDDPYGLIKILLKYENTEDSYYKVRKSQPQTALNRAARFLYLTRLSFNGIHRVNLKGQFNVPYGRKEHLSSCDEDRILEISCALNGTALTCGDFEACTSVATKGDVVYFDPPYTVAHSNNGFVKYNERIFSWADQERLAKHARILAKRGCRVIVSNADHASVHGLYKGFDCTRIERASVIAASSSFRRRVSECIFVLGGE
jgi:DNA adenine methylase